MSWSGEHMKALLLGQFAAGVAPRILAKVKTPLETSILYDEGDADHLAPLLSEAEIVVGHIWRRSFPPAPRLRLFEAVTAFREGSWIGSPQFGGGPPHGEVMGRAIGIIGYGRIGRGGAA